MPTLTRLEAWPELLHDFIEASISTPFKWGACDCCTFSANAVQAMTNTDPAAEFRGFYVDEAGSRAALKSVGCASIEDVAEYVAAKFSMLALVSVYFAQRGDLLLYEDEHGQALGIVYLNGVDGAFVGANGLYRKPVSACKRAWAIGERA
jgi:hypothetical protein